MRWNLPSSSLQHVNRDNQDNSMRDHPGIWRPTPGRRSSAQRTAGLSLVRCKSGGKQTAEVARGGVESDKFDTDLEFPTQWHDVDDQELDCSVLQKL